MALEQYTCLYCTDHKNISDVKVENFEWRAIFRGNDHHLDIKHIVFLTSKVDSSASKTFHETVVFIYNCIPCQCCAIKYKCLQSFEAGS